MFSHHRVPALFAVAGMLGAAVTAPPATAAPAPLPGGIIGTFWMDNDRDGIQDPDEPGKQGITLTATWRTPAGPPQTFTVTTGDGGHYRFANLPAGTYTVRTEPLSSMLRLTLTDQGVDDSKDSDFNLERPRAHEGKDVGTVDTTVGDGTQSDLDGGVFPVL